MTVVLAFDVGGTWLRAALVGEDGALLAQDQTGTPVADGQALVAAAADLGRSLADEGPAPDAVGLAVAGLLDVRRGRCVVSPNLQLRDAPLAGPLAERLGLPVVMVNDVNAAALAEARAAGCDDLAAVFLGTGVGTGCVVGGRVLHGARGMAVELGHLVFDPTGPPCPMGCRGCYEAFLGGLALGDRAQAVGVGEAAADLLAAWRAGDTRAAPVILRAQEAFLSLVPVLLTAFDPDRLVVGGGLGRAWPELVALGQDVVAGHPLAAGRRDVVVEPARLGGEAGLLGAAWNALQHLGHPADATGSRASSRP